MPTYTQIQPFCSGSGAINPGTDSFYYGSEPFCSGFDAISPGTGAFCSGEGSFYFDVENNIEVNYRYCFGIINPNDEVPQEIILSFDPVQGRYIKSLPIHATQQILVDNEDELRLQLKLYATHDFIMELLSYGDSVKVIKPKSLITELKLSYQKSLKQY